MNKYMHGLPEKKSRITGYFVTGYKDWGPEEYSNVMVAAK
jgi:nitrogen regulatory protein PII-like uncharacterized protein